jgi:hypothetical protein
VREHLQNSKRAAQIRRSALAIQYFEATAKHSARILLQERPQPRLIGSSGIGALGYYLRLPILDVFGIVDAKIARSKAERKGGVRLIPGHHRSNADVWDPRIKGYRRKHTPP